MATWTYQITCPAGGIKAGAPLTGTIRRITPSENVDTSLYTISTSAMVSSTSTVQVNASGVSLTFGSYGSISPARDTSTHALSGESMSIDQSILSVSTTGTSVSISEYHAGGSGNGVYLTGQTTFTISVTATSKYYASSFSASNGTFGENHTVSISNTYISELNHTVKWTIGSHIQTNNVGQGVASSSFTIPISWCDATPNATSITCSIVVTTYKGSSLIGTNTRTVTISVPSTVRPTIGSVTATILNGKSGAFAGRYFRGITGVRLTINNPAPGTGATLAGYNGTSTTSEYMEWDSTNLRYDVSALSGVGNITFTITASDSRGRTSEAKTVQIYVENYSAPTISAGQAIRCTVDGVANEDGTYASIRVSGSVANVNGNTIHISSQYYDSRTPGIKITAEASMVSDQEYISCNGNLDPNYTYYVVFTVTDGLGYSTTKTVIVQTAAYSIHVKNGGLGVAFGKTCEINGAVEINPEWDLYMKGVVCLPVVYSESIAPSNPFNGLVWLKKKV